MILNTTQKAAISAIEGQQEHTHPVIFATGQILLKICEKEPESAQRVLDALTGEKPLRAAVKELLRRARENGLEPYEVEGILREIYGLDEPLEENGEEAER